MKAEEEHTTDESKGKNKVVIELTDFQSEIFDKVVELVKKGNEGRKITREIILTDLCTTYIANEGQKLIKQG